jgi:1-deoxy-D-xylulose-5-phosphate synthase
VPIKEQPGLIEIGKAEVIRNFSGNGGRKVALFPLGNMMPIGLKAGEELAAEGIDIAVINPRFIKPLDAGVTEFFARGADVIVTLEDHVVMGGYGSAVLELLNEKRIATPVIQVGWPDQFIEHATTTEELRSKYGLTVENTVAKVRAELGNAAANPQRAVMQLR